MCISQCYGSYYSDPQTGLCALNCSAGLIINSISKSCVGNCTGGLFQTPVTNGNTTCSATCPTNYYADTLSAACVTVCSANPMTFATTTPTRSCVTACPSPMWHDVVHRLCVTNCTGNGEYAYSVNVSCISSCPSPNYYILGNACVMNCSVSTSTNKYSDDTTRSCVADCPTGYYKDPTTYKCVINCPISPVRLYASRVLNSNVCVQNCTSSYANNLNGACVTVCPLNPQMFA